MALTRNKTILMTTGVITLAVCALVLVLLLNIQVFKPQIEAAASDALGMEVRIKGRLGIALFPGIGISLNDVTVRNRGTDVVTVQKMKIGLRLIPLIRREVLIHRVGLIKPVITIVRYKDGTSTYERPGRTPSKGHFGVDTLSLSQGKVVYSDERTGKRIEGDDITMTMRSLSYSGKGGMDPIKDLSFDGDMRCGTLRINSVTLTDLVMRAAGKSGMIELNPVSMHVFGGTGTANMQMDMTGALPRYTVSAALDRFRVEDLVRSLSSGTAPREGIEGTADFSASLTATGKGADEVKRSLTGSLSLNGENLLFSGLDIDALITKYERSQNFNLVDVGAFFLAGPFGPVLTKGFNFASLYEESRGGKGAVRKLVSVWNVTNGIAGADDVALATKKHRIAMKGGLDFINDQFVDVTVAVLDKRGCAVYSQKVRGPFREPQIEKVGVFRSIGGSVSNALTDAWKFIRQRKCGAFYSGSVAQPEE
ncbi:MAG: AsmA family protein [Nitrospirota bacterium]